MTEAQAVALLRKMCAEAGGQAAWARAHDISPQWVCDILAGRRAITDRVAKALDLLPQRVYLKRSA